MLWQPQSMTIRFVSQSGGFFSSHVRMQELDHEEGWVLKNWCFQIVVLEKTLESPLDYKEIKPVSPKGNQPWYSLEGLMLKLKYSGHLMWRTNSLEKTLMLEMIEGRRRDDRGRDGWMASPTQWAWVWVNSGGWWWTGRPGVLQSMGSKSWIQLTWTATTSLPNQPPKSNYS